MRFYHGPDLHPRFNLTLNRFGSNLRLINVRSYSTISKLNPDQFTYSGDDDDASSDSTPNVTTPKSPRKRRRLATST